MQQRKKNDCENCVYKQKLSQRPTSNEMLRSNNVDNYLKFPVGTQSVPSV